MSASRGWIGLGLWLIVTFAAGAIGTVASASAPSFYRSLDQPAWAPGPRLFGPIWTTLYVLMAGAAWLVWRERGFDGARTAIALYVAQLALNALWTWIFFVWHRGALALAEILVLSLVIVATIIAFWRVRAVAGALLLPYLAWVAFASVLTFSLWRRNPALLG